MPTVHDINHKDTRPNIPTEELRDFVDQDELAPQTALYPREIHDPQLVWKGKEEQDQYDLAVAAVPIYIQEEIEPKSLINDLFTRSVEESDQPHLFPVSVSGTLDRTVDFYQHEETWRNRLILGDSLLVMTSLAEKEGLKGKVQTIYIDPPYGIKFGSNWQVSTRKRDVKDGKAEDATREPEQVKAFRDTWQLGIHSYLSYLRDRLTVARELLTDSGSIFVQIGDENVHLVRAVMDEVFGSENFRSIITIKKTSGLSSGLLPKTLDFLLWYSKSDSFKYRQLFSDKLAKAEKDGHYSRDESGALVRLSDLTGPFSNTPSCLYDYEFEGKTYKQSPGRQWKTTQPGMTRLHHAGRIVQSRNMIYYKRFANDFPVSMIDDSWDDISGSIQSRSDPKIYVVQTSTPAIARCILMTSDPGDLVLDPTCGSGTTAHVAEEWGRRWITIDTSRVALALARTRLMAARYPYYVLADSPEGVVRESQLTGVIPPEYKTGGDIRKGFVYERVPHVTLKSIANNPDIREGMTRAEIDAAIARHADQEVLYDRPYEDRKKVRVTGPFSVESLSPHRVLPTDDRDHDGRVSETEIVAQEEYETRILNALKASGVQNTIKGERITFDRLDPFSHPWINATGEYTDAAGESKRIAISIGPEHGTVGAHQVNEAAKEAVKGIGFDILVVCGFAFDSQVSEEAKRFGKLTVLPARMSMELIMSGDGQLKNTGAGNLFMVFGEPDIDVRADNGQVTVEIRGVDVYDPSTGAIRSNSTDDLACWFIDTSYNGEAFFVRHAYFTGATEPYDKLKRALRAEIDESAWSTLYQTTSRPFPTPETGRIAVKAINHYGDEVMKVIRLEK